MPSPPPPQPPAPARPLATAAALVCAAALATAFAWAHAAPFDDIEARARDALVSDCLPVQYREGAQAYRACVEREAQSRAERDPGALELLELDERYAVERRCGGDRERSEIAWLDCIDAELESLAAAPAPRLADLREDERHALLRECFDVQASAGAAPWRGCMVEAAAAMRTVPRADLTALAAVERNTLQAGCSSESEGSGYRRCLLERGAEAGVTRIAGDAPALPAARDAAPASLSASSPASSPGGDPAMGRPAPAGEPSLGAASAGTVAFDRVLVPAQTRSDVPSDRASADAPDAVPVPDAGPGTGSGSDPTAEAFPTSPPERGAMGGGATDPDDGAGSGVVARLADTYAGLDGNGRLLLWGALALPLLLLVGSALLRRRGARDEDDEDSSLAERIGPTRGRPAVADGAGAAFAADARPGRDTVPVPPGHTSRIRHRLNGQADDLFDALDRDLDRSLDEEEDPDDDFADDSLAFGAHETPDFGDGSRDVSRHLDVREPDPDATADLDREAPTRLVVPPRTVRSTPMEHRRDEPPDGPESDFPLGGVDPASDAWSAADRSTGAPPWPPRRSDRGDGLEGRHEDGLASEHEDGLAYLPAERTAASDEAAPARPGFGEWLVSRPDEDRLELAVEFLVYWMAWGDERYDPATRDAVFADDGPVDDATFIKRRVLEEDVSAFADTVRWLVLNASREARSQVLELLVALLVTDPVPTPVQNTLLRFLADAFGIGAPTLEHQFEQAFEAPLPPLPRADRPDWWTGQDEAGMVRREGRALALASEEVRHRARLGLSLDTTLNARAVRDAFELASRRTAPERFDALGERERTLAARQLDRFAEARDALMETIR